MISFIPRTEICVNQTVNAAQSKEYKQCLTGSWVKLGLKRERYFKVDSLKLICDWLKPKQLRLSHNAAIYRPL